MSDDRSTGGPSGLPGTQTIGASGEIVTQAEIDDVINDPRLSVHERAARLSELRQRFLDDEHASGSEDYAPLRTQIMDALSMLAEGGHDYDGSLRVEGEGVERASPSAEPEGDPNDDRR